MSCFIFFFSADVAGSAIPHLLTDMEEVMERERGTEVGHCCPLLHKFTREILWAQFEQLQNQYLKIPLGNSAPYCSNNSFKTYVFEKDMHK